MKINIFKILFTAGLIYVSSGHGFSQTVQYFGHSRSEMEADRLTGESLAADTSNPVRGQRGYVLLDVGLNITPNTKTRINAITRIHTPMGGFFGAGNSVFLRQLYVKGSIADAVHYHVGDMDIKRSRFTLFNSYEEGRVNEASVFSIPKNIIYYENFYDGNRWRVQGAQADYSFMVEGLLDRVTIDAYAARNRLGRPIDNFMTGANLEIEQSKYFTIGGHVANFFTAQLLRGDVLPSFSNPVQTAYFKSTLPIAGENEFTIFGEAGRSTLTHEDYEVSGSVLESSRTTRGGFFEIGTGFRNKKQTLYAELKFRDVSNTFFSAGAQTKRLNFGGNPFLYPFISNDMVDRGISLYDISRDNTIYNMGITQSLMAFDPRLANTLPYGDATPNRSGLVANVEYTDEELRYELGLNSAYMSESVGQGTNELRTFILNRATADVNIDRVFDFERRIKLTLGAQHENTSRNGVENVDAIKLNSYLVDAGIEVETFSRLDLMLGAKLHRANGNEFLARRDIFNEIYDFIRVNYNTTQSLYGLGVRYRFTDKIFLTVQGHHNIIDSRSAIHTSPEESRKYNFDQIFILFNMTF